MLLWALTASIVSQLLVSTAAYRQPYEYLEAIQSFAVAFTNPSSVINSSIASPLAEEVVGRIDVTTTFVGQELNTEYLFGLFVEGASETSTQLIGSPSSYTTQSLVVEPPVVAVSLVNNLRYPTINSSFPLQIDLFIAFDDDMKIISYDATLRRWSEFFTYLVPLIAPQIAQELNYTTTNTTELISMKTAVDVCGMSTEYCTGTNQVYDSNDACMEFMTQIPFGNPWEGGMDNGWCRYIHKNMVKYRPEVHCPHIGPTGGDMCIARDYVQVTEDMPFNNTLLSYNASYNALDVKNVPDNNRMELVHVGTEVVYMTTVAFYSVSCVLYMLLLYVMAKLVESLLGRFSLYYRAMSITNKRNSVTYVMDIFLTTGALVLQLVSSPVLNNRYTFAASGMLKVTALIISGLYIFELTYRISMRWPLMTHHFCTIFAIVLLLSVLSYTRHPALMGAGNIWLFQATTEQSVFVGLLMYRLDCSPKLTRNVLYFAAIQSLVFKLGFAAYLLAFWAQHLVQFHSSSDDIALSVLLVILTVLLMSTQVYGAGAVWGLAKKVNRVMECPPPSPAESTKSHSTLVLEELHKV
ncbi:hypothetical protein J3R30DRAFT_3694241 [Lentinula aciculospora]|uniref:Uncharacterized protein n=1 Tax=Lentinula aciculospora TaxID=153920 RepID=A0A9W9AWP8_9AGAR|nr:hypothetical protein J3R30DRAFT_3694241 [Lentinula aciculospora]